MRRAIRSRLKPGHAARLTVVALRLFGRALQADGFCEGEALAIVYWMGASG